VGPPRSASASRGCGRLGVSKRVACQCKRNSRWLPLRAAALCCHASARCTAASEDTTNHRWPCRSGITPAAASALRHPAAASASARLRHHLRPGGCSIRVRKPSVRRLAALSMGQCGVRSQVRGVGARQVASSAAAALNMAVSGCGPPPPPSQGHPPSCGLASAKTACCKSGRRSWAWLWGTSWPAQPCRGPYAPVNTITRRRDVSEAEGNPAWAQTARARSLTITQPGMDCIERTGEAYNGYPSRRKRPHDTTRQGVYWHNIAASRTRADWQTPSHGDSSQLSLLLA
jgi:hypothetical protein